MAEKHENRQGAAGSEKDRKQPASDSTSEDVAARPDPDRAPDTVPQTGARPGLRSLGGGYRAGSDMGGLHPGGVSAAEVTGGGTGGDIDLPDITGRGSTADVTRDTTPGNVLRPPGEAPPPGGTSSRDRS